MTWAPPVLVLLAALAWWWPGAPLRSPVVVRPAARSDGSAGADLHRSPARVGGPAGRRGAWRWTATGWRGPVVRAAEVLGRRRAAAQAERDLLRVLDALAAALRSGASPRAALGEAAEVTEGPLRDDLSVVQRRLAMGETTSGALAAWSERRPLPGIRLLVAVLTLGTRTGGDLARAVDDVAATERHRRATRDEVRSLSAQARLSAVVVAVAPVAFTALAALADPGVGRFLLATPLGWGCLLGGTALDLAGAWWMRAVTRSVG